MTAQVNGGAGLRVLRPFALSGMDAMRKAALALVMLLLGLGAASPTWAATALTGNTGLACNATYAGYIRYNSGKFEGCNGSGWIQLAGGGYTGSCRTVTIMGTAGICNGNEVLAGLFGGHGTSNAVSAIICCII